MSEPSAGDIRRRGTTAIDKDDGSTAKKSKQGLYLQPQFYSQGEQGSCHSDHFHNQVEQGKPSRECSPCSGQESQASTGEEGASHIGNGDGPDKQNSDQEANMISCSHLMKQIGEELNYVHEAFRPLFIDCELAENMCIDNLDSLLTQAKEYEESLIAQKQQLRGRLSILSQTLKLV